MKHDRGTITAGHGEPHLEVLNKHCVLCKVSGRFECIILNTADSSLSHLRANNLEGAQV